MSGTRYWRQLKRHPLSAEYADIKGKAWDKFVANLRERGNITNRKIMLYEGQVIDGWQLHRAHVEVNVKPEYRDLRLPKGMTAEEWVETVNDDRRHETQEKAMQRAEERRERVATARAEGQSTRAIAEEEEVSQQQVRRDLQEAQSDSDLSAGETPVSPEPETVVGRDGKTYPATPPLLCDRCKRVGAVANCPGCKIMREEARRKPKNGKADKPDDKPAPVDAFGTELPKRCRAAYCDPWVQKAIDFLGVMEATIRKERLADGMVKRKGHYPFFVPKDFVDGVGMVMNTLDQLLEHLKDNRPASVCPCCYGKGCGDCRTSGIVPRRLVPELKKKAKAAAKEAS